jgi:hypothetical protein
MAGVDNEEEFVCATTAVAISAEANSEAAQVLMKKPFLDTKKIRR